MTVVRPGDVEEMVTEQRPLGVGARGGAGAGGDVRRGGGHRDRRLRPGGRAVGGAAVARLLDEHAEGVGGPGQVLGARRRQRDAVHDRGHGARGFGRVAEGPRQRAERQDDQAAEGDQGPGAVATGVAGVAAGWAAEPTSGRQPPPASCMPLLHRSLPWSHGRTAGGRGPGRPTHTSHVSLNIHTNNTRCQGLSGSSRGVTTGGTKRAAISGEGVSAGGAERGTGRRRGGRP